MTEPEHEALAEMLAAYAITVSISHALMDSDGEPHALMDSDGDTSASPSEPGTTSTPVPPLPRSPTLPPATATYAS